MDTAYTTTALRFLLLLALTSAAWGSERGAPLVQVYDAQQMGGANISTDIVEMADGRIVVANMAGLLRFDGARWLYVQHPQKFGGMEHLAAGPGGRIYSSFHGDIGYYLDDAAGQPAWHSLLERFPPAERSFADVLSVEYDPSRHGAWFTTYERVVFVPDDDGPVRSMRPEQGFEFGALVGTEYWVEGRQDHVMQRVISFDPPVLEPVPGGEHLKGQRILRTTRSDDDYKISTRSGRLLSYRDGRIAPWVEDLQPLFEVSHLISIVRLRDGRYVLGSTDNGPVVIDAQGHVVERYGADDGVPVNRRTHGFLEDRDGGLWLAQDKSIVRVDLARAVTVYDESRGLPAAYDAKRWHGQLYVASGVGLYRLVAPEGPGGGRFERVLPHLANVRSLAVVDEQTLLVSDVGVQSVSVDSRGELVAREIAALAATNVLELSRFVPGRVWVGYAKGVLRLDRAADGSFVSTPLPQPSTAIYRIGEQDARRVWVADRVDGLWLADVAGAGEPKRFRVEQGLPDGTVRIYSGPSGAWFTTMQGVKRYDASADRLVALEGLPGKLLGDRLYCIYEDAERNLWVRGGAIINDVLWNEPGGWRQDGELLSAVDPHPTIFNYLREGTIAWAIRANGLLRFDLAARTPLPASLPPLLAQVANLRTKKLVELDALSALGAQVRDVRFDFALPALHRPEATVYRSRLSGFDTEFSDWGGSEASSRVYTNLPDGHFKLELEARDGLGRLAAMAPLPIAVAPPWWRSTFARIGYVLATLASLWLAAALGARRRQRLMLIRHRELEAEVDLRTQEIKQRNEQLAEQAQRLAEVDRLKTRFFVNVGHEFRTPLTLVLGPIEDLLRDSSARLSDHVREQLELAHRNARRVLALIVEILDVNRLEQGHLPFRRERIALDALLRRAVDAARPLVERHGHTLVLTCAQDSALEVDADPAQIERCVSNLIGNAAKFMSRGGRIEIGLDAEEGVARISVRDHGRGIAAAALPHVFDRFFQTEGGDEASGYGVGLALVREIVEGHDGRIAVQSSLGEGSTFTIALPLASATVLSAAPSPAIAAIPDAEAVESNPPAREGRRERPLVLVVDDHDDLRLRLRHLFEDRFEVAEAADGPTAWRAATERLPDVIVCDVMMPGFDGVELTRRLRANPETAAIALLLLTAKAGSEHAVVGLNAGANDYLEKPFDSSELLARVESLLAQAQRLRHQLARANAPVVETSSPQESAEERWRRKLDAAIDARLDDSAFGVDELAQAVHGDRSTLFRKSKQQLGMSPSEYLRERRLARGRELLLQSAGSVSEVAYAVGFDSLASFTRAFKTRFGEPPSAVRAGHAAASAVRAAQVP